MPTSLSTCASLLTSEKLRHHVDAREGAIRIVFLTRHYENPRGEKLAIVRIETPDDGHRLRASIVKAFAVDGDPASTCLACCRLAADTPLVGVEYDADEEGLRLVAETAIEDARLTKRQLLATIDRLVAAAEAWHVGLRSVGRRPAAGDGRATRGVA